MIPHRFGRGRARDWAFCRLLSLSSWWFGTCPLPLLTCHLPPGFLQPLRCHHQHGAPLVFRQRVHFVGDEETGFAKWREPAGLAQEKRQAFRGGNENVRWLALLLGALLGRGVAGARADAQPMPAELVERLLQVLPQVVREGAKRR